MESLGPWRLIKAGFWMGIGFTIFIIAIYIPGTYLFMYLYSLSRPTAMMDDRKIIIDNETEWMNKLPMDSDKTNQVKIIQFREVKNGNELLILGTAENIGETSVSSINIEAELLDVNGQMLFECSAHISKKLKKGEKENFQIRCGGGCGDQPVLNYNSVSVRVVGTSNF